MDRLTREVLSRELTQVLNYFKKQFQLDDHSLAPCNSFQNWVFHCESTKSNDYILRITHSLHRSYFEIEAELDWIRHLSENINIDICRPILSRNHKMVEQFETFHNENKSFFYGVLFEKALGVHPRNPLFCPVIESKKNQELSFYLGNLMGKLHKSSSAKSENIIFFARPVWYEEDNYNVFLYKDIVDSRIIDKAINLLDKVKKTSLPHDQFGLIHADFHNDNVLIGEEQITLIDFDGAVFGWFIHDIAISFFDWIYVKVTEKQERQVSTKALDEFWRGYLAHNRIEENHLDYIPFFLKLEEIGEYFLIHRSFNLKRLYGWRKCFMKNREEKIIKDKSFSGKIFKKIKESYYRVIDEYTAIENR